MAATSLLLRVRWVIPGEPTAPTVLAFTGFGHRLDPWMRLRAPGWRVGVIEFPVGNPPDQVWTPDALAEQVDRMWQDASHRVLMSFSFGGAGATILTEVLSRSAQATPALRQPDLAIHVAPVQWARIPWPVIRSVPQRMRLPALKQVAKGGGALMAMAGKAGGHSIRDFVQLVDKHVGWDFVAFYLPYLDWIQGTATTLRTWDQAPWPNHLIGALQDRVIPVSKMRSDSTKLGSTSYHEYAAAHFNAVDAARSKIFELLSEVLLKKASAATG